MTEYFVSPSGNDSNTGEDCEHAFLTIKQGLKGKPPGTKLKAGDILTICGGTYLEEGLEIKDFRGEPGNEITIRAKDGQRVIIDSGFADFRAPITGQGKWVPAKPGYPGAHPEEWFWDQDFDEKIQPYLGAFLDMPYRRLVTYATLEDFRANNQGFGKIPIGSPVPGPWKAANEKFEAEDFTYPWVYMGPGLFLFDIQNNLGEITHHRLHIRLSHTTLEIPGLENYLGPTNPNEVPLAICERDLKTLVITNSRCLTFSNLIFRFGGRDTISIDKSYCLTFEGVEVLASERGIRFGEVSDVTFANCRFDGGLPPWFFRTDLKAEYNYLLTKDGKEKGHNALGKRTMEALMLGDGYKRRNFEIHHCEFVNAHDLYLVATNMHFHHNWIDNLHDEGMVIDAQPSASGRIHSNVITRCLSPISTASDIFTAGPWYIYRNLIDLRLPTAGNRPDPPPDPSQKGEGSPTPDPEVVFRFGNVFKTNEARVPDGPFDIFHNTFLVARQVGHAAYLHYESAVSPHRRRSFNNIFVAFSDSSKVPISFIPPPTFPGPTDGNIYHRFGAPPNADAKAFLSPAYRLGCDDVVPQTPYKDLDQFRSGEAFKESKVRQYAPGYEARSRLDDPGFKSIAKDGSVAALDDLRLLPGTPARFTAVKLPPDLLELDLATGVPNDVSNLPWPFSWVKTRASGCYAIGGGPLEVGVNGQRRFPNV